MASSIDLAALLKGAIEACRAAGLTDAAAQLEARTSAAFTTSSEWLGEVGLAVRAFLAAERHRAPATVVQQLDACLTEVGKVWPKLGKTD